MALDTGSLSLMANALKDVAVKMRLHTADPGTGNSNSTTAPDQTIVLVNDGNGNLSVSNVAFTGGAANGPCTWLTLWSTSGSTRYGKFALTGDATFNAAGEYTVTSLTIAASST